MNQPLDDFKEHQQPTLLTEDFLDKAFWRMLLLNVILLAALSGSLWYIIVSFSLFLFPIYIILLVVVLQFPILALLKTGNWLAKRSHRNALQKTLQQWIDKCTLPMVAFVFNSLLLVSLLLLLLSVLLEN